jgi:hypothetical protein
VADDDLAAEFPYFVEKPKLVSSLQMSHGYPSLLLVLLVRWVDDR